VRHAAAAEVTMEFTRPTDRTIELRREFAAPRQKVFEALTRPDRLPKWFAPAQMSLVSYESDFRAGGSYRYVFQRPSGKKIEMRGVYREVETPRRWVYTETHDFSPLELLVTVELDETAGKTVFRQTILYPSKEERDGDFGPVSDSAALYEKLERYLAAQQ
jgi:uncharacterized protein YndB with AHSA1/START domain